eukprot:scaffold23738_cov67-Phaeocystis_antarctica.AAC.4
MAYPAVRPLPKLPLPLRPETGPTSQFEYVFGQNLTEYNPAPSPSGHPLLSGPPTLINRHSPDIHSLRTHCFAETY